ncbi:hypothetical protein WS83_02005 [Burkholderia sp. MSMB2042]|nr:hypothetical protein WS78_31200 [Burkholderia savannae]KVG41196.1 hypothetical protein WS77_17410 [Burkholderia sp. MSMB0265]KVG81099.1 hypothetical protein WS81_12065 [Burkholderia sp. MSMB2040]KVG95487.1 hypothetical protein WS82_05495 [Burkholderia sp. MSMB2041]KVG96839.1 hypothetical protein WS83_02005 [Burkholderia sp. MSMB2042]KVK89419.1 hypothetical protein WS91_28580 [Burkholderia sp. MSMB1498]
MLMQQRPVRHQYREDLRAEHRVAGCVVEGWYELNYTVAFVDEQMGDSIYRDERLVGCTDPDRAFSTAG